jgi:CubicO group peptidase (beta-lactamase class C family)
VGIDAGALERMLRYVSETKAEVSAMVVLRHGKVVLEANAYPHRPTDRHTVYSCTKSVTSILVGIAVAEGLIPGGVDARVVDLFPEWSLSGRDGPKGKITLRDLLTMRSGLDWTEDFHYGAPGDSWGEMVSSPDPVRYVLDRPMREEPGTVFQYASGVSHVVGAIVQRRTGKTLSALARERLFRPLGITDVAWESSPNGLDWGGWGLQLRPEDLAKVGQLLLDGGRWRGQQLGPASWVAESTRKWTETSQFSISEQGYGYQWWQTEQGYMASGYGGQYLFVNPEQDLVAVFFSALPNREAFLPRLLMQLYVAPSVGAEGSPAADERLRSAVEAFERPPSAKPVALPAVARAMNGAELELAGGARLGLAFPDGQEAILRASFADGECVVRVGLDGVPRVNQCQPLRWIREKGPVAFTGWFDGDTLVIRHAAMDGTSELLYRMDLGSDPIELSVLTVQSGDVIDRSTWTRWR